LRNPEVPAALDEIVRKAVAKDPARRFQTADEFRVALLGVVPGEHPIAVPVSAPEAENVLVPASTPTPAPTPRMRGFHSSRAVILMALLPTVMLAGFYAMRLLPAVAHARARGSKPGATVTSQHDEAQVAPAAAIPSRVEPGVPVTVTVAPAPVAAPTEAEKAVLEARPRARTPAKVVRQAGKNEPSRAIRVTGGELLPAAAITAPSPTPLRTVEVPEPPLPKKDSVVDASAESDAALAVTTLSPEAAPAKSQNGGSWFTRALGKVNPFRKAAKRDGEGGKAPVEKN
jgi:serine/threonine-protein kinase